MLAHSDEDRLYDPAAADQEAEPEQALTTAMATADIETESSPSIDDTSSSVLSDCPPPEMRKRIFILEPAVFIIFVATTLSGAVQTNLILYQTCTTVFHYNKSDCQPLLGLNGETPDGERIETEIQPYAAQVLMTRSLLESLIPAVISLFIGPWSDKFGRRPVILTGLIGHLISFVILCILTLISTKVAVTPWMFLLASVPTILCGGICSFMAIIYCYISDATTGISKAYRMLYNQIALWTGMMAGNVASSYVYAATNMLTLFFISAILIIVALAYVYFYISESLKPEQIQTGSKIREFFSFGLLRDLKHTCFDRRPNFDRAIMWFTLICLILDIFSMEGEASVLYLFVRRKFEWTLQDYSIFNATRIVMQVIGGIVGMVVLRRLLKFSIVSIAMISVACCVLESTVRATVVFWWEMYIGIALGLLRGLMGPMSQAILSNVVPSTEVGKVFALTTSLVTLLPMCAVPLYTVVYNASLISYPGAFNFISVGLYLLSFTMISAIFGIYIAQGTSASYQEMGS